MSSVLVIGIAGGSGSGKSTMAKRISEVFCENVVVLNYDSYYKRHDEMTFEERTALNYDHPDALDTALLIEHIKMLESGIPAETPVYDYTIHNRIDETKTAMPAKIIVIDGILIFENEELRNLMDIKIFVDTEADVRLIRRIRRDMKKRGRSLDSIITQYLETVKPMHDRFVEPSKRYADIIVPEGGKNQVALDMIINMIYKYV